MIKEQLTEKNLKVALLWFCRSGSSQLKLSWENPLIRIISLKCKFLIPFWAICKSLLEGCIASEIESWDVAGFIVVWSRSSFVVFWASAVGSGVILAGAVNKVSGADEVDSKVVLDVAIVSADVCIVAVWDKEDGIGLQLYPGSAPMIGQHVSQHWLLRSMHCSFVRNFSQSAPWSPFVQFGPSQGVAVKAWQLVQHLVLATG